MTAINDTNGKAWVIMPTLNRYQSARYRAFAALRPAAGVLEIAGGGSYPIPGWRSPTAHELPNVVTLFENIKYGDLPGARLCARLEAELNARRAGIAALAVMGWEDAAALCAIRWASTHAVPIVVMSESNSFDARRHPVREWVKQRIVGRCAAGLAGGTMAAQYLMELGLPPAEVFVGYDVVDNDHFTRGAEAARRQGAALRGELNVPETFFLASGRMVEKKNLPRLVQAYARYRQLAQGPVKGEGPLPWGLVILGSGPQEPALRALIAALGVSHDVRLPGVQAYEALPPYYGLASAFVHASTEEQWGLVVNEALASALPVLVSDRCGCATDLVCDGVNGYTFDPFNVEQLALRMHQLAQTPPAQLEHMGVTGQALVRRWSPAVFGENLWRAVDAARAAPRRAMNGLDRGLLWALLHLRG